MLAVSAMSATVQCIFFIVAFILFVLATIGVPARWNLVAAGLAVWVFVLFWNSLAQT